MASASDRQIVVYSGKMNVTCKQPERCLQFSHLFAVSHPSQWETVYDVKNVERIWLRPSLDEMYDLQWSPDSAYVIACSIDS